MKPTPTPDRTAPLLAGPIFPALTLFTVPILFSLVLQALYGAVDLWMVSRYATNADVSAVSTGSQTMLIVNGLITGLTMGVTILLGQSTGRGDDKRGAAIIGNSLRIFGWLAAVTTVLLLVTAAPLASLLNAPEKAFVETVRYIRICGAGTVFIVAFNVMNGIFCGLGDSRTPLLFVGIACLVNIIGDYLLIDLLQMGATGAAVATIAAQATSVLLAPKVVLRKLPFPLRRAQMAFDPGLALAILRLGLPVALLRMCTEISYLVLLAYVNVFGEVASSGVGIAEKLVMFILLIPTSYLSSIAAFVAQNVGAGRHDRATRALWTGLCSALVIGGASAYLSFFRGDLLSLLFIKDPAVVAASSEFLKATAIECFVLSAAYCFDGYFNGIGKTTLVMVRGMTAALLIRIPYAYYASTRPDASLFQIGLSTAYASVFMLLFCLVEHAVRERRATRRPAGVTA